MAKYDEKELEEYLEEASLYELIASAIDALYHTQIDKKLVFELLSKARHIAMQSEFHTCSECGRIIPNKKMKYFKAKDDFYEELEMLSSEIRDILKNDE